MNRSITWAVVGEVWAAGFFDGEGCILVNRHFRGEGVSHTLRIKVGNTDFKTLAILKSLFGGRIYTRKLPSRKLLGIWQCSGIQAENALKRMNPYLVAKRQEAEVALDFYELQQLTKYPAQEEADEVMAQRDAYYWKLRELKRANLKPNERIWKP